VSVWKPTFHRRSFAFAIIAAIGPVISALAADVKLGFQGRLQVAGTNFTGQASFKFALVPSRGGAPVWTSSADANSDGEPDASINLTLNRGVFALALGDTAVTGMAPIPEANVADPELVVRMWFRTGSNPFARLLPDQPLSTVGRAVRAGSVRDGSIRFESLSTELGERFSALELDAVRIGRAETNVTLLTGRLTQLEAQTTNLSDGLLVVSNQLPRIAAAESSLTLLDGRLTQLAAQSTNLSSSLAAVSNQVVALASAPSGIQASTDPADASLLGAGFRRFQSITPPAWRDAASTDAPLARSGHVMAASADEVFVWGGLLGNGSASGSGSAYRPATRTWRTLSTLAAPAARAGGMAAGSSTGFFVWGGFAQGTFLATGGFYGFDSGQWTATATASAPTARDSHGVAWTGSRFLVWGGRGLDGLLNDGGAYDPVSSTWTALPSANAPQARLSPAAAWTGSQWILWGGSSDSGDLNTGARLAVNGTGVPTAWSPMTLTGAPSARSGACAVWTGSRFIVWGGVGSALLNTGASYDPVADQWTALPTTGAPAPRTDAVAEWSGDELIVFGGLGQSGPLSDGAAFNPGTGRWRSLGNGGSPVARSQARAVWCGTEFFVFGGVGASGAVAALQHVDPQPAWHLFRKP
jgi:hypothetical protein